MKRPLVAACVLLAFAGCSKMPRPEALPQSYETGKTLTILRSDGTKVTYKLTPKSQIPNDLVVGKKVVIVPVAGSHEVQTVVYTVVE